MKTKIHKRLIAVVLAFLMLGNLPMVSIAADEDNVEYHSLYGFEGYEESWLFGANDDEIYVFWDSDDSEFVSDCYFVDETGELCVVITNGTPGNGTFRIYLSDRENFDCSTESEDAVRILEITAYTIGMSVPDDLASMEENKTYTIYFTDLPSGINLHLIRPKKITAEFENGENSGELILKLTGTGSCSGTLNFYLYDADEVPAGEKFDRDKHEYLSEINIETSVAGSGGFFDIILSFFSYIIAFIFFPFKLLFGLFI